ncbi:MAG: hypothetical protein ACOCWG_04915, partial [bacterium]
AELIKYDRLLSYYPDTGNLLFNGVPRRYYGDSVGKGVYDSKNLALYTYCHQNPMIMVDPDGNLGVSFGFLFSGNYFGMAISAEFQANYAYDPEMGRLTTSWDIAKGAGAAVQTNAPLAGNAQVRLSVNNTTDVDQNLGNVVNVDASYGAASIGAYVGNDENNNQVKGFDFSLGRAKPKPKGLGLSTTVTNIKNHLFKGEVYLPKNYGQEKKENVFIPDQPLNENE